MSVAKEVFVEAHRLIQDVGLCKGVMEYKDADGHSLAYCSIGALSEAAERICGSRATYEPLLICINALNKIIGTGGIIPWNDDPAQTKSEVLSAFSRAIASIE
jgi:hypothetical protein